MNYLHPDSSRVTSKDAIEFKRWMGSDRADFERTKPAHPMYYDNEHLYKKDRTYWLHLLIGMGFVCYATAKIQMEQDRARMTARLEGYKGMPGHHFNNRGGVVVLKDFTGFEKYFASGEAQTAWLKKAYPH